MAKLKPPRPGWVPIVMAADCIECPDCHEPYCKKHRKHYHECSCVGPDNAEEEGYELREYRGRLWGVPIKGQGAPKEDPATGSPPRIEQRRAAGRRAAGKTNPAIERQRAAGRHAAMASRS